MGRMIQIDMPMPESCLECPLKYEATEGGSEYCCLLDKRVGETYRYPTHRETWMKEGLDERRLQDCPLVEAVGGNETTLFDVDATSWIKSLDFTAPKTVSELINELVAELGLSEVKDESL